VALRSANRSLSYIRTQTARIGAITMRSISEFERSDIANGVALANARWTLAFAKKNW